MVSAHFSLLCDALDGHAAEGFGAAYFSDEGRVLAAAEAGASPSLYEFDPLITSDSAADAALPRDTPINVSTDEVPYHLRCGLALMSYFFV